ncbi:MFS transporter [Kitasatospora sp. NPDC057223]|uniref:MFS transporter n=1 Tax=Kitasatospora sp. NPDC057223 TaxID=3346055 RepID=UPI00364296A3
MTVNSTPQTADPAVSRPVSKSLVPLLTGGMGLSMLVLYTIGALGPSIIDDLGISRSRLGLLPAVAFGTATVLSLYAGHLTDLVGGRRAFIVLTALIGADFALLAAGHGYPMLLVALVLAGVPQALANPSTNKLIAAHLPPQRRALAIGIKQSGAPLAALIAGLSLPALAHALSWRTAILLVVPIALLASVAAAATLPRDQAPTGPRVLSLPAAPNAATRWLMAYSLCVGCGLASLSTYLPLYAHQRLGMGEQQAGALISAIGLSGIITRVLWARFSSRLSDIPSSLLVLAVAALGFAVLIPAATHGTWLVWIGALGLGGSAAAANAVSMIAVTKGRGFGQTGHASALVSMGFFAGFVAGPIAFGLLADGRAGFGGGWTLVCAVFLAALLCARAGRVTLRASA